MKILSTMTDLGVHVCTVGLKETNHYYSKTLMAGLQHAPIRSTELSFVELYNVMQLACILLNFAPLLERKYFSSAPLVISQVHAITSLPLRFTRKSLLWRKF